MGPREEGAAARRGRRAAARRRGALSGSDGKIPEDINQQAGRRLEEMKYELAGEGELFSRDPIVPPADQGTKENPILGAERRARAGRRLRGPGCRALVWFTLTKGPVRLRAGHRPATSRVPVGDGSGGH